MGIAESACIGFGGCGLCGVAGFVAGTKSEKWWDGKTRTVHCVECGAAPEVLCEQCAASYCKKCNDVAHSDGKKQYHSYHEVKVEKTANPVSAEKPKDQ